MIYFIITLSQSIRNEGMITTKPIFNEEMSDTLYVSFAPEEKANGIELNAPNLNLLVSWNGIGRDN